VFKIVFVSKLFNLGGCSGENLFKITFENVEFIEYEVNAHNLLFLGFFN